MDEIKVCPTCETKFERPDGMPPSTWERRKFCSRLCATRAPRPGALKYDQRPKTCATCGREFSRPANQRGITWASRTLCSIECVREARRQKAWEKRPRRTCPICGEEFRSSTPAKNAKTCGKQTCKARYRREIVAPERAAQMRAAYAAGKRPKSSGISPREQMLWPSLAPHGFTWRMKWWDAWGCFEMDFSLPERKLNVEIDGPEHGHPKRKARDADRDAELERRGWRILRIPNDDVDASPEAVAERILTWSESA